MPDLFRRDYLAITDNLVGGSVWDDTGDAIANLSVPYHIAGNGIGGASTSAQAYLRPAQVVTGSTYRVRFEARNSDPAADNPLGDPGMVNFSFNSDLDTYGVSADYALPDDPAEWIACEAVIGPVTRTAGAGNDYVLINVWDSDGVDVRRVIVADESTVTLNRGPVRLEVQADPADPAPENLVPNPSGELGAWGWLTPTPGAVLTSEIGPSNGWQRGLVYTSGASAAGNAFTTALLPILPSAGIGGAYRMGSTGTPAPLQWRVSIQFYNALGTPTHATTPVSYGAGTTGTTPDRDTVIMFWGTAGAGDAFAAVKIELSNGSGVYPLTVAGETFGLRDMIALSDPGWTGLDLAQAASQRLASGETGLPWTDLLGETHDLTISREALNIGTLSARLVDPGLDPAGGATTLRPGRAVRVTAYNPVTTLFEPLFRGKITNARTDYAPLRTAQGAARDRIVTIEAADDTTALANAQVADTVATVAELPHVLEGIAVPYVCDGSSQQVATAAVVIVNDNTSALDQVAITRDTVHGSAWVDRHGVLQVWTTLPAGTWATLTNADYNPSIMVDFDTARCINELIVRRQWTHPTAGPQETVYGPYRDIDSISQWGRYRAEFTVAGTAPSAIPGFAATVLGANASPTVRATSLAIPVVSDRQLELAHVDLYDQLALAPYPLLVPSAITHTINCTDTGGQWLVGLEFDTAASVAAPTQTPSAGTGLSGDTGWVDLPLRSGISHQPGARAAYRLRGGELMFRWGVSGSGLTSGGSTPIADLPVSVYNPTGGATMSHYAPIATNDPASAAIAYVNASGAVYVRLAGTVSYAILDALRYRVD